MNLWETSITINWTGHLPAPNVLNWTNYHPDQVGSKNPSITHVTQVWCLDWIRSAPSPDTHNQTFNPQLFWKVTEHLEGRAQHRKRGQTLGLTPGLYFPSSLCFQINPDVNMLLLPQPQATSSTTSLLPPTPYKTSIYPGMLLTLLTLTTCSQARPLSTAMSCSS